MTEPDRERRVLILAPTGRDAINTHGILARAGIDSEVCEDVEELCSRMREGAAAALITDEALGDDQTRALSAFTRGQEPWSDFPFIVLTRGGADSPSAIRALRTLGNVVLLERPVRVSTCVAAARAAVRMRMRQYQLRALLAQLRDSDRRKDEFLAMLAHELRNPLAPIRNSVQMLKLSGAHDVNLQRAGDIVERQVAHLARLVDDLLDVSRITRGKIELKRSRLSLDSVIANAVETSRPLIDGRRQLLAVTHSGPPLHVEGDLTRLAQVVANLLNNASKFTPEGGHIWLESSGAGDEAIVRVRDDGIGIPSSMQPSIFDLFVQVDGSLERSRGGLGIGLTLVRRILDLHGGSVSVSSEGPGRGSEFTVRLPVAAHALPAHESQPPARCAKPAPMRILVVDDNVDAAETMALLLTQTGHDVRCAYDGFSALDLSASFAPDVVLLDIGLPGISGFDVAMRIRQSSDGEVPCLVALSGYARPEDRERAREAGFDHYLIKPVEFDTLLELLGRPRLVRSRPEPAAA